MQGNEPCFKLKRFHSLLGQHKKSSYPQLDFQRLTAEALLLAQEQYQGLHHSLLCDFLLSEPLHMSPS